MQNSNSSVIVAQIARHQSRLRGLVRCMLVRASDVDDVLQEINAVLWEKASEFESGTDFWAWASQIARFKALNYLRKHSRERLLFDESLLEQLAETADRRLEELDQRRAALDECLKKLPPAQHQLVDLRYSGGHAIEAISKLIGRPEGSIRQTLFRIRSSLLSCIESRINLGSEST
jgi:RNA polymerase sigma-70 factor, ECF subfamily